MSKSLSKLAATRNQPVATPIVRVEPTPAEKFAHSLEMARSRVKYARTEIDKFVGKVAADPLYALSWGEGAFGEAATLKVWSRIVRMLETAEANPADDKFNTATAVNLIVEDLTKDVLRGAKYPARSTSVTSNLAEQCELAAKAQAIEDFRFAI